MRVQLMGELRAIAGVLDDTTQEQGDEAKSEDPLAAYWEQQIANGEDPDLDLTLDDLKKMGKA